MGEITSTNESNAINIFSPIEHGVVKKFDALFDAREKTLTHWLATKIKNKQEFLHHTFPNLISIGAEHPQLSGGVLYMMGTITKEVPNATESINSIPRRFAEQLSTKKSKELRPILHNIHMNNEPIPTILKPEQTKIVHTELTRAKITKELYDTKMCFVPVQYEKGGKHIDLGKNGSEIAILNRESKIGKTMVFLCSSGGNPKSTESFAVEYALKTGNRVIIIGQPDGANGQMTDQFAQAVYSDAQPPMIDLFRKFKPPSYTPHTEFMKQVIQTILANNEQFDLYGHSGGSLIAKNLLHDPDITKRVKNAVLLNPAGVTTMDAFFPTLFRLRITGKIILQGLKDLPHLFRTNPERDKGELLRTPAFNRRERVTAAVQIGTHYRQPDWDTMKVNGGKIVLYVGGKDIAVGGKQFARFMKKQLQNPNNPLAKSIVLEYDKKGYHGTPWSHPEEVFNKINTYIS